MAGSCGWYSGAGHAAAAAYARDVHSAYALLCDHFDAHDRTPPSLELVIESARRHPRLDTLGMLEWMRRHLTTVAPLA